ncbi:LacI family DNA-binding transcriptional regulator [Acidothermaceae bacterium B102]|nr:LacI family DNA-binding transcriptional regulator [Acidothermaceae bacterium B102]
MAGKASTEAQTARPTLASIAAAAGVSLPTVSKVVNGRTDVSPQTRARVERLLHEHRYLPPGRRRAGRTGLVNLVFNEWDSPCAIQIVRGVEDFSADQGRGVVVSAVGPSEGRPASWNGAAAGHDTDGVILVTSEVTIDQWRKLHTKDIPLVVIDPVNAPGPELPSVGATNWAGGISATEHLLELGHRRIGVISGPGSYLGSRARLDGYRYAMERAGIAHDADLVRYGDFQHEGGFRCAAELLDLAEPPTAIFSGSDQMALGVYEAARQRGLLIPRDLSVVGFDDLPVARWLSPPLTTVRQPLIDMGRVAAEMLWAMVDGQKTRSQSLELATELIVRDSTAAPR